MNDEIGELFNMDYAVASLGSKRFERELRNSRINEKRTKKSVMLNVEIQKLKNSINLHAYIFWGKVENLHNILFLSYN
jgi:hypothetical protein